MEQLAENIGSNFGLNTGSNISNESYSSVSVSNDVVQMMRQSINVLLISFNEFNKSFSKNDLQNFYTRVEDESFPEFIVVGTQESTVQGFGTFKKHFQDAFEEGVKELGYQILAKINGADYAGSSLLKIGVFGKNVRTRVYYNTGKIMTNYVFNERDFKANNNELETAIIHNKDGNFNNNGVTKTIRLKFNYCHNDCGFEPEGTGLKNRNLQKGAILTTIEINDGELVNIRDYITENMSNNQMMNISNKFEKKKQKTNRRLFIVNTHLLFASDLPDLGNTERLRQMMLILKRFNLPDELLIPNTMLVFHGDLNFRINKRTNGGVNSYKQIVRDIMGMQSNNQKMQQNQLYQSQNMLRRLTQREILTNDLRPLFMGRDTSAILAEVLLKLIESIRTHPFEFTCIFDHHKTKVNASDPSYVNQFAYKNSEGMMPSVCDRILYTVSDDNIYFKPRITPIPVSESKSDHIGLTGLITIYPGEMGSNSNVGYGFYNTSGGSAKKSRKSRKSSTTKKTTKKTTKRATTAKKIVKRKSKKRSAQK